MTLKATEAEALLVKLFIEPVEGDNYPYTEEDFTWSEFSEIFDVWPKTDPVVKEFDGYQISMVEDFGGGEGSGELRYMVFKFENSEGVQYFRKNGFYASYDGSSWDGAFYAVKPEEYTSIRWVKA